MKYISTLLLLIVLFTGCSSKNYFEPVEVVGDLDLPIKDMPDEIKSFKLDSGVTLKDGSVLISSRLLPNKLGDGFNLLNYNNSKLIAVNNNILQINSKKITLEKEVVAGTLRDNILALVFIDNSIALYDLVQNKIIFKEYYEHSFLNDIKIANPYFMDKMVLFPTLDGKIIVVDLDTKKVIKDIVVSSSKEINNIIYLGVIQDNFIASTSKKIISIGNGAIHTKDYDISSIVSSKSNIFIATIDGKIIKLDKNLTSIASKKYKFANFFTMLYVNNSIYTLESQEYIVVLDDNFTKENIYEFDFDNEEYAVAIGNTIYFEDKYLEIK
jgi:hypothetical protein